MTQFVGTHPQKLDRKGRVSVPAPFRSELDVADAGQLIFRLSHQHPCIEARPRASFQSLIDSIRHLEHFSEEREAWEAGIIADSVKLRIDGDGRITLPEEMTAELGLTENVAFLGKGEHFEIWDGAAATAHIAENRAKARERRMTLTANPLNTTPRGVP